MISPLLCNVYLHRIDRAWDVRQHGVIVRFADDVVVMCKSREQAEAALARLRTVLAELGLEPKEAKTRIVHLEVGGAGLTSWAFIIDLSGLSDAVTASGRLRFSPAGPRTGP